MVNWQDNAIDGQTSSTKITANVWPPLMRIKDLGKLNLRLQCIIRRLKLISTTAPAALKNGA